MISIKRILCPIDFSDASRHAIDHAIAMARWTKASLACLHVYELPLAALGLPAVGERATEADIKRLHDEVCRSFEPAKAAGVPVDFFIDIGQPVRRILERAAGLPADVIVMGTHGAGGFEHLVLGSVAEKVLRKAPCPVLTVPPRAATTSRLPFRHLVCAVDFSDSSLTAVELACSIAEECHASLTLLHVIEWPWEEPPAPRYEELPSHQAAALLEYRRDLEKRFMGRLKELIPESLRDGSLVDTRVRHGKSYVEILRIGAEVHADLIVIGVHGRNAPDLLFGSTTNQVVRGASCPVMTLRR